MKFTKFRFRTIADYDSKIKSQEEKYDDCKKFFWWRSVLFRAACLQKKKLKYFGWRKDYIHFVLERRGKNNYFPGGYNRCFLHFLVYLLNLNFMGQFSELWPQDKENKWWSKQNFNIFVNTQIMIELNDLKEEKFYLDVWNKKVNFCMFMIIIFRYFHFFRKNSLKHDFAFFFFHSRFYLLNLFRLGCLFFEKFRNLQSLIHINHVWNAQNYFFFHFYCKQFL